MDQSQIIGSFARHLLTTVGGALVSKGILDSTQVEPLAGAIIVVAGVLWSIWQKRAKS